MNFYERFVEDAPHPPLGFLPCGPSPIRVTLLDDAHRIWSDVCAV